MVDYDPFAEEIMGSNPHPIYQQLRNSTFQPA
jgi:hypothetical protein